MDRVYHEYKKWEDYQNGMFSITAYMDEGLIVNECKQLLSCEQFLEECMIMASHTWFYSAEHNLTNTNRNRQAWLGQAACCYAHGAPEYLTKAAWNCLTQEQQKSANSVADVVIKNWEELYSRGYFKWLKSESEKQSCKRLESV